jgi:hypothetical protein
MRLEKATAFDRRHTEETSDALRAIAMLKETHVTCEHCKTHRASAIVGCEVTCQHCAPAVRLDNEIKRQRAEMDARRRARG